MARGGPTRRDGYTEPRGEPSNTGLPTRNTTLPGVTLRPVAEADLEFLYRVYAASRSDEMALLVDWSEEEVEQFLRFQFEAQHRHYQTHYPNARYDVIVREGEDAGRLYVQPMANEIRVMDIALLPEHRGQGIGRALMQEVLDEAASSQRFVSLHVEGNNPAKRLYERMGFTVVGEVSFYELMHWIPAGLTPRYEAGFSPSGAAHSQVKTAS